MSDLQRDAEALQFKAEALLKTPSARMLPAPVRELIRELVRLVHQLAVRG